MYHVLWRIQDGTLTRSRGEPFTVFSPTARPYLSPSSQKTVRILSSPRRLAPFPIPLFANRSIHALGTHEYCARDYRPRDSLGITPSRLICSTIRHLNEDTIAFWIVLETNSKRRKIRILLLACARNGTNRRGRLATESELDPRISLYFAAYLNDVGHGGQIKTLHYIVSLEKEITQRQRNTRSTFFVNTFDLYIRVTQR